MLTPAKGVYVPLMLTGAEVRTGGVLAQKDALFILAHASTLAISKGGSTEFAIALVLSRGNSSRVAAGISRKERIISASILNSVYNVIVLTDEYVLVGLRVYSTASLF